MAEEPKKPLPKPEPIAPAPEEEFDKEAKLPLNKKVVDSAKK